jgi:hypothetical protein
LAKSFSSGLSPARALAAATNQESRQSRHLPQGIATPHLRSARTATKEAVYPGEGGRTSIFADVLSVGKKKKKRIIPVVGPAQFHEIKEKAESFCLFFFPFTSTTLL